eukprot:1628842-Prorocentrum_lima.AAC.1
MVEGRLTRIPKKTSNPGVWLLLWRQFSPKQRLELIKAFRANRTGVFAEAEEPTPRFPKVILDRLHADTPQADEVVQTPKPPPYPP